MEGKKIGKKPYVTVQISSYEYMLIDNMKPESKWGALI